MNKRKIAILGSTGTIGKQTLSVIKEHPDLFQVELLTAKDNSELLIKQAIEFNAECAVICNKDKYREVADALKPYNITVFAGNNAITDIIRNSRDIDMVLTAMVGFSGLEPTMAAIESGKIVAIANKEPLVAAGKIIMEKAADNNSTILPVDSEHSAIFQSLQGEKSPIEKILLTASGGPFRETPKGQLQNVTLDQAINHPNWKMGPKVSIDSSTLMNKGFEMIEARWLFNVEPANIEIVIHPQSIIHSMVQFQDGSIIAQMNMPDMRLPIQYALTYPNRIPLSLPRVDFPQLGSLTFCKPDFDKFPCLSIAFGAIAKGGNIPCAMSAADEIAVKAFMQGRISYKEIPSFVEKGIEKCDFISDPSLDDIIGTDMEIKNYIESIIR